MRKLLGCLSLAAKYLIYICGFVCIFIITTQDGIWRALGLSRKGVGEKFRENVSCPCWASQPRNAEPFAGSVDWLLRMSVCGRGVWRSTLQWRRGPCWPLDGTAEAFPRGRHVWETEKEHVLTIVMIASTDWSLSMSPSLLLNAVPVSFLLTFAATLGLGYYCDSYFLIIEV